MVVPNEKAVEPSEEAYQPFTQNSTTEAGDSQRSALEPLSQPNPSLSHRERLEWLQVRRRSGLWVQCDTCSRWRYLPHVLDRHELPDRWECHMNPNRELASCSVPEKALRVREEEDLIHGEYSAGSVVWARMRGYPWWPAMVCDCPDTEQYYWLDGFSDIPTHYNVVFFDEADATRAWIAPKNLRPFKSGKQFKLNQKDNKQYKTRLAAAIKQADEAKQLPIGEKLAKYSFIARYKGEIHSPKVYRKEERKQETKLKRRLNIKYADDENEFIVPSKKRKQNESTKIILGSKSPKKLATRRMATSTESQELKESTSLAVQVGSKESIIPDSLRLEESFDNDTSKTYVPGTETQDSTQPTENISSKPSNLEIVAEPGSDDFEY